ncbi:MAG: hypothetical protein ABR517_13245 [Thermoanaerobaculia bacterium]
MLRRLSAVLGIILLVAILIALVWAVHQHRLDTGGTAEETRVQSRSTVAEQQAEGEQTC